MHVDVRQADQVIIVDLEGRLVAGTGDEILRETVNELLARKWTQIVLNLSGIKKIDSSGIGELVASVKLAERMGAAVKLLNIPDKIHQLLELSLVLPMFEVYQTEEQVLEAFAAASA